MKKPVLAAFGVAAACVACCTLPLVIPLLGGAAALGLTSWLGMSFRLGPELLVLMVIASVAVMVWGALTWRRQRRAKACGSEPSSGSVCEVSPEARGCRCAPNTGC